MPAGCIFGGVSGAFLTLTPSGLPTAATGVRVIPHSVFWPHLYLPWMRYLGALHIGIKSVTPPNLGPPGSSGFYFTDSDSLKGCDDPAHYVTRLSLSGATALDVHQHGCAVVEFALPPGWMLLPTAVSPGAAQNMTFGGGREWVFAGNLPLDPNMIVKYVRPGTQGPRYFELPL